MNIYDEAIELENEIKENRLQLTKEKYRDLDDIKLSKIIKSKSDKHDKIIKALERAKKVEELLTYQNHYIDSIIIELDRITKKAKASQIGIIKKELGEMK